MLFLDLNSASDCYVIPVDISVILMYPLSFL